MSRFITRRVLAVVAGLVVASASVAVAVAARSGGSPPDGSPMQLAPSTGQVPVVSGTPSAVVTALAAHLPLVSNAAVVSTTIPGEGNNPGTQGLEVTYDLHVKSTQGPDIAQALWEGDLLVGAIADEYAARGFGQIVAAAATLVTPDGARDPIGGGVGEVVRNQVFNAVPSDIGTTISSAARGVGLHSVSVATIRGLQDAVVIHAVSNNPASDVAVLQKQGGLDALLQQSPANFEGAYLEIDNTAGSPVYIVATAPRDGSGTSWSDPSLGLSGGQLRISPAS
jgi:hypothetical protein